MVTQVKGICVYKLLRSLFASLFGIVEALFNAFNDGVWNVKQPEANWQEHELDEVADEEVVVGEEIVS